MNNEINLDGGFVPHVGMPAYLHQDRNTVTETPTKSQPLRWPELMRLKTLAEYLDMSQNSVKKLIDSGLLPPPSFSPQRRMKRWPKHEVDHLFYEHQTHQTTGKSMDSIMAALGHGGST